MKKYSVYQKYSNKLIGEYDTIAEIAKALNVSLSAASKWVGGFRKSKEFVIVRNNTKEN